MTKHPIEIWGTGEIASAYGVKPGTVRDLWMAHPEWPAPAGNVGGRPVWLSDVIRHWVIVHRRPPGRPRKLR